MSSVSNSPGSQGSIDKSSQMHAKDIDTGPEKLAPARKNSRTNSSAPSTEAAAKAAKVGSHIVSADPPMPTKPVPKKPSVGVPSLPTKAARDAADLAAKSIGKQGIDRSKTQEINIGNYQSTAQVKSQYESLSISKSTTPANEQYVGLSTTEPPPRPKLTQAVLDRRDAIMKRREELLKKMSDSSGSSSTVSISTKGTDADNVVKVEFDDPWEDVDPADVLTVEWEDPWKKATAQKTDQPPKKFIGNRTATPPEADTLASKPEVPSALPSKQGVPPPLPSKHGLPPEALAKTKSAVPVSNPYGTAPPNRDDFKDHEPTEAHVVARDFWNKDLSVSDFLHHHDSAINQIAKTSKGDTRKQLYKALYQKFIQLLDKFSSINPLTTLWAKEQYKMARTKIFRDLGSTVNDFEKDTKDSILEKIRNLDQIFKE